MGDYADNINMEGNYADFARILCEIHTQQHIGQVIVIPSQPATQNLRNHPNVAIVLQDHKNNDIIHLIGAIHSRYKFPTLFYSKYSILHFT